MKTTDNFGSISLIDGLSENQARSQFYAKETLLISSIALFVVGYLFALGSWSFPIAYILIILGIIAVAFRLYSSFRTKSRGYNHLISQLEKASKKVEKADFHYESLSNTPPGITVEETRPAPTRGPNWGLVGGPLSYYLSNEGLFAYRKVIEPVQLMERNVFLKKIGFLHRILEKPHDSALMLPKRVINYHVQGKSAITVKSKDPRHQQPVVFIASTGSYVDQTFHIILNDISTRLGIIVDEAIAQNEFRTIFIYIYLKNYDQFPTDFEDLEDEISDLVEKTSDNWAKDFHGSGAKILPYLGGLFAAEGSSSKEKK